MSAPFRCSKFDPIADTESPETAAGDGRITRDAASSIRLRILNVYYPDFLLRLKSREILVLETKGKDD